MAVSADGRHWFLLNVSADVRQQLLACPELRSPPGGAVRGTRIAGCLLTDAEIDHTSGLLQLREGCAFGIFSTALVHRWLTQFLPLAGVLALFADRPWTELPLDTDFELPLPQSAASGLHVRVFETGRDVPRFVPEPAATAVGSVVGLRVRDSRTGGVLVYAPGVAALTEPLRTAAADADCVLLDGTFWTDDEPILAGIGDRTAGQMGHLPVSGPQGSLSWLAGLPARHRAYLHINNTNPMLNDRGPERRQVVQQQVRVAVDGDTFEL